MEKSADDALPADGFLGPVPDPSEFPSADGLLSADDFLGPVPDTVETPSADGFLSPDGFLGPLPGPAGASSADGLVEGAGPERPEMKDVLADHRAAGNIDASGKVTLRAEIAADRENRSWLDRNVTHPLERAGLGLLRGIVASQLEQHQAELEALNASARGDVKGDSDDLAVLRARFYGGGKPDALKDRQARLHQRVTNTIADVARLGREIDAVPQSPVYRRINETEFDAEGARKIREYLKEDPGTYAANLALEAVPGSIPPIITSVLAARAGGAAGAGGRALAGGGAGSAMVEYVSSLVDEMQALGVDVQDPAAIQAAVSNPGLWSNIQENARRRAAIVGMFDTVTMGLSGRNLAPRFVKGRLARGMINSLLQAPIQGAGGGLSEVTATLANGQQPTPGALITESLSEASGAPVDVATSGWGTGHAGRPSAPGGRPGGGGATDSGLSDGGSRKAVSVLDSATPTDLLKSSAAAVPVQSPPTLQENEAQALQKPGLEKGAEAAKGDAGVSTKKALDGVKIPDMTDQQLSDVSAVYGANHNRAKAAAREIARRVLRRR